ncbi:MAG: PKD domain-containing protein [Chitinophagales bacterium]
MKSLFVVLAIAAFLFGLNACGTQPAACFKVTTPADSIRVGKAVQFDGSCSNSAKVYKWDFGNGEISNEGRPETVYDSAGNYDVLLLVLNGGKSSNVTQTIVVKP